MEAAEAIERVSIGWQLTEKRPEESDYEPRGGTVIDISTDRQVFTFLRNAKGKLKMNVLNADQIDWSLSAPASMSTTANTAIVMLIVRQLQGCKPAKLPRYLVKALYELSLKLGD